MTCYFYRRCFLGTAVLGCGMLCLAAIISAQESRIDDGAGIEILARGPVHEAFAEPVVFDPKPGLRVPNAAPELVEELPPDQRPAGENVAWIPGYWAWDTDRDDFLWVSGFWRSLPPGREWVPGYWVEVSGGWQWVSGYWGNANEDDTVYLPAPPETLETGPTPGPPSDNHFWVPGCWYWREARYVWRPGYWTVGQTDWIWSPAHYVWTPRGHVFVGGYWDYALPRRGVLFAPVYFSSPFYSRPGYFYTPSFAVDLGIITNHFFVGLGHRHYYFGDYYDSGYYDRGFFHLWGTGSRFGYDPIYTHYHHHHGRRDRDWDDRVRRDYERRRDNEDARPDRIVSRTPRDRRDGQRADERTLVRPLTELAAATDTKLNLQPVSTTQRKEIVKVAQETREFTKQRRTIEADATAKTEITPAPTDPAKKSDTQPGQDVKPKVEGAGRDLRSNTVKRPRSPIVNAPKADAVQTPKPDVKAQPKAPGNVPPAVPKVAPKAEPKPPIPDRPVVPKPEPNPSPNPPSVPKVEPKPSPNQPSVPKVEPRPPVKPPIVPKVEPPKVQPNIPKAEPPAKIRPEVPKAQEPPKVRPETPRTETPPKVRPVEPPAVRPVEPPKVRPVEPPKVRPEAPRVEPKPPPRVSPPSGNREPRQSPKPEKEKEPKK